MSSSGRIAVSDRKYIDIYDSDFVYQKTLTVIPPQEEVSNIELYWSPDETFLAVQKSGTGLGTHEVTEIWRVDTGELLGVIPNNYFAVENTLVWHPDSQSHSTPAYSRGDRDFAQPPLAGHALRLACASDP